MRKRKQQLSRSYKRQILSDIFSLSQRDIDNLCLNLGAVGKNDRLFMKSNNPNDPKMALNAYDNDLYFSNGYICSSVFLLDMIHLGKSYLRKDSYLYPALFCFRMFLEIIMKLIIVNLSICDEQKIKGHNLTKKWEIIKNNYNEPFEGDEVKGIESMINELSELDCNGATFRYPKILNEKVCKGSRTIKTMIGVTFIDVANIKEKILQLYRFFEGLHESTIHYNTMFYL